MEYLKNKDIILKLNSVVTKQNVNNINEIAQVVSIYKIQRWKLFKFISLRGKSVKNKNEFDVENAEFENLINEIKKQRLNCQVIECKEKEIEEILRTFDKAPSPSSENITLADYDFTYEIKDNQLYIDFVNESAHDATYEFSVKGDTLILIGGEGTIGGTYELTKVHDKKADK